METSIWGKKTLSNHTKEFVRSYEVVFQATDKARFRKIEMVTFFVFDETRLQRIRSKSCARYQVSES